MKNVEKLEKILKLCHLVDEGVDYKDIMSQVETGSTNIDTVTQDVANHVSELLVRCSLDLNDRYLCKKILKMCDKLSNPFNHMSNDRIINLILEGFDVPVEIFDENKSLQRCFVNELTFLRNDGDYESCKKYNILQEYRKLVNNAVDNGEITL